jgi:hypothetical protein
MEEEEDENDNTRAIAEVADMAVLDTRWRLLKQVMDTKYVLVNVYNQV